MPVTANTYDAVPYESYPYPHTHPRQLRTIARLFSVPAVPLERARVLELGCAAGGNILPIAADYPDAEVVGVDLSAKQIADGQRVADAIGLRNISLRAASILEIDDSFGQFDYIICHGVFSWVPPDVQDKILAICKANLSPTGVAFVSYNTLPGWNMVRSIREMMMYHTRFFGDPAVKAQQARALLKFIQDATQGQKNPYVDLVQSEAKLLQDQSDSYLLHEHLEENNIQLYFYQFMERAAAAGLGYLGDAALASMYTGNLPEAVAKQLNAANDIVRTEQYMDFLNNRRFRNTVLFHAGTPAIRTLNSGAVADAFTVTTNVSFQGKASDIDLTTESQVTFGGPVTYTVANRTITALMLVLDEQYGHPISVADLAVEAARRLKTDDVGAVRQVFVDTLLRLVLGNALSLHIEKPRCVAHVSERPAASALARYQAKTSSWITTQRHGRINLDAVQRLIVQALDGINDQNVLAARIVERIKSRELGVSREGRELTEPAEVEAEVKRVLGDQLTRFARAGLLVA